MTTNSIDEIGEFVELIARLTKEAERRGREMAVEYIERNCPKIKNIQAFDGNLYVKIDNMPEDPSFMLLPESVLTSALTTEGK